MTQSDPNQPVDLLLTRRSTPGPLSGGTWHRSSSSNHCADFSVTRVAPPTLLKSRLPSGEKLDQRISAIAEIVLAEYGAVGLPPVPVHTGHFPAVLLRVAVDEYDVGDRTHRWNHARATSFRVHAECHLWLFGSHSTRSTPTGGAKTGPPANTSIILSLCPCGQPGRSRVKQVFPDLHKRAWSCFIVAPS